MLGHIWRIAGFCMGGAVLGLLMVGPAHSSMELNRQGMAAIQKGDPKEAARLFEDAYKSFLSSSGEQSVNTLSALSNLAFAYSALARYAEAVAILEKVIRIRTETSGERDLRTLNAMNTLGLTYNAMVRLPESLALLEKVLKARTEILGERHSDTLSTAASVAVVYKRLGRFHEGLALGEKTLKIFTDTVGERNPSTLIAMTNVAEALVAMGRNREALALREKALSLHKEVSGTQHPNAISAMGNLALGYGEVGRSAEALKLLEDALKISQTVLGERHPTTVNLMNSVAGVLGSRGQLGDSLLQKERVFALGNEVFGETNPQTIVFRSNLASAYAALGRNADAIALQEKIVEASVKTLGAKYPDTLGQARTLAAYYLSAGRTSEARDLAEKVLQDFRAILGETHPSTSSTSLLLASIYLKSGRAEEALAIEEKLLKEYSVSLGERHPVTIATMGSLALVFDALGRSAEALTLKEKAAQLLLQTLGDRHPNTLEALLRLAVSYQRQQRLVDASGLAERYVAGAEFQRSQPGLSTENRQSVFQDYANGYRFFGLVHGGLGQIDEGLRLSELGKARTLLESMATQQAGRSGSLPPQEQGALDDLRMQLQSHNQLVTQAANAEARQNLEAARNDLVRRFESLQARLKSQYPKYAQLSDVKILAVPDLPGLVSTEALAISYVVDGDEVAVWLVDSSGKPKFVHLGKVNYLAEAVEALRRASADPNGLKGVGTPSEVNDAPKRAWRLVDGSYRLLGLFSAPPKDAQAVTDEAEIANFLSARLLLPVSADLDAKVQWIISPDGPLAQLPFELLSFGSQRVLEQRQVHYTQSLSIYAQAQAKEKQYRGLVRPKDLFAMGNPIYGPVAVAVASRNRQLRNAPLMAEDQFKQLRGYWPNLPGTKAEIDSLVQLFPNSDVYVQDQASEARLQELNAAGALKNYRYLHFAVHGNLSTADPALSSLVLNQVNVKPGTDGYVTAAEWPGYDLTSDLTVLSACETGLGKTISGEGVMGLPFALFVAGSVNTVLSLWPVPDEATAEFMAGFFAKLKAGQTPAKALTNTRREFAKNSRLSKPVFWAPFVLVGAG